MELLNKYRRKEMDGFKQLIRFMDLIAHDKREELLDAYNVEDPVYMQWVIKNLRGFQYLLTLSDDDALLLFNKTPNNLKIFVAAFFDSAFESQFIDKFPQTIQRQYKEEKGLTAKLSANQQEASRIMLLEKIYDLQNKNEISPFSWDMPPIEILRGNNYTVENGQFCIKYENGQIAVKGPFTVKQKLRNGLWRAFHPNGTVMAAGEYKDGMMEGKWLFTYPNGKLHRAGIYKNDKRDGNWEFFSEDGTSEVYGYLDGKRPGM